MRAAVVSGYGGPEVVRIAEVTRPKPSAGEILVRVKAAAVTSGDARIRAARFPSGFGVPARLAFGVFKPRRTVLGSCFSGIVADVGAGVVGFTPGDEVAGMTGTRLGAHAEYLTVPTGRVVAKPASVWHEDAAGVLFGGTTALYFLRDRASVQPGAAVLVNGASGAVGTNAVQIAAHLGAIVAGVTSAANADLVRGLGADRVIDYAQQDLATIEDRFDVVVDVVGNLSPASGRRLLIDNGVLVLAVAGLADTLRARGNVIAGSAPERAADFAYLLQLVDEGSLVVVHDRSFDLAEIQAAHRRIDSGRKTGNIIVRP